MSKLILFLLITLIQSCSYFINKADKQDGNFNLLPKTTQTYCPQKNTLLSLFGGEDQNEKRFLEIINNNQEKFNQIDLFVLWSLTILATSPESASPDSPLELIFLGQNGYDYWKFTDQFSPHPYINGLERLLTYYNSKHNLKSLIVYLDSKLNRQLVTSEELAYFLKDKKTILMGFESYKDQYYRAEESLIAGEKFSRPSLFKLVQYINKKESMKLSPLLLNSIEVKDGAYQCSFDILQYEDSLYKILPKISPSRSFGIKLKDNYFMAITSLNDLSLKSLDQTIWFEQKKESPKSAICLYWDKNQNKRIAFTSHGSRDPGQHLFHFSKYNYSKIKEQSHVDQLLKFSRHLFLTDPLRLIYETSRGDDQQLTELLKLNIPIYNANSLGHIDALFIQDQKGEFIIDNRHMSSIQCK